MTEHVKKRFRDRLKSLDVFGIIFLLVLFGFSMAARSIQFASSASSGAVIVNGDSTGWIDDQGYYTISGEAQNNGTSPVENVTVSATLYNSSGNIITVISNYTALNELLPGRISGFQLALADASESANVSNYALSVSTFIIGENKPAFLNVTMASSYIDENNMTHIFGTITNNGSETATEVTVEVTCYNDSGYVMDVLTGQSTPNLIDPGQTGAFDVALEHAPRAALTTNWTITVESQQYEMIPEYNMEVIIAIFLAATAVATVLRKHR